MASRPTRTGTALLLIAMLLFSQAALAIAYCDWLQREPARAISGVVEQPCHDSSGLKRNANLCLAHCQSGSQSIDKHSVTVAAVPAAAVLHLTRRLPSVERSRSTAYAVAAIRSGAPPPPHILYHELLI